MAIVTKTSDDCTIVEGDAEVVCVLCSLDDVNGVLYYLSVAGSNVGVSGDYEHALTRAESIADNGLEDADDEHDQFRDDVEADADVLANAGMGTDEDYGYFGGYDD